MREGHSVQLFFIRKQIVLYGYNLSREQTTNISSSENLDKSRRIICLKCHMVFRHKILYNKVRWIQSLVKEYCYDERSVG